MNSTRPYRRVRYRAADAPDTFRRLPSYPYAPFPPGLLCLVDRGTDSDGQHRLMVEIRGRVAGFLTETPDGSMYVGSIASGADEGSLIVRFNGKRELLVDFLPNWIPTHTSLVAYSMATHTNNSSDG